MRGLELRLQELQQTIHAENPDICYSIPVNFVELASEAEQVASALLQDPLEQLQLFDRAAVTAQESLLAAGAAG